MNDDGLTAQEEAFLRGEPEAVAALETPAPELPAEPEKPAAEPEKPVEKAAEDPDADEDKLVPHGALAEARAKARTFREQLAAERQEKARLEGRLEALLAGQKPAEPEKPIKFADDPMKAGSKLEEETAAIRAELKQMQDRDALRQHISTMNQALVGAETAFKATTADYEPAKLHARTSYFEELKMLGYDDQQAFNEVVRKEQQLVNRALQNGSDPADMIYKLAKSRGWAGPKPAPVTPTPADKVAIAAKGQEAAKSLGAAPGGAAAEMSVEALAGLSDEEFAAKFGGEKGDREFRKMFGG